MSAHSPRSASLQVLDLIQLLALDNPVKAPARAPEASGNWRLVWSQQAENANPLQKLGSSQVCASVGGTVGGR